MFPVTVMATILIPLAAAFLFFHGSSPASPNILPILTCFILVPNISAFLVMAFPVKWTRWISLVAASVELGIAFRVFTLYQNATGGFQLVEQVPWLKNFGIQYLLGVDGMSTLMVVLVA